MDTGINVYLTVGKDKESSSVKVSGSIQHIITDDERKTFGIEDEKLKKAIGVYFKKSPDDAYLHSPTPWGDLYKTYGWPQVKLVLEPVRAEILGITSKPEILKTQDFENKSDVPAVFNVSITDSVTESTSSSWETGGTLTLSQSIGYFIGVIEGQTSASYSQTWGIGGTTSRSTMVGSSSGVSVTLNPGQSTQASLSASRGIMKVSITYNAYLVGCSAVNYNPRFDGHHFWALDIGRIMSSGNISNLIRSVETLEIGYFSNSKIVLEDKKDHKVLLDRDTSTNAG